MDSGASALSREVFIRPFQEGDEAAFRTLNERWINQYFSVEAKDREVFADPHTTILEPGGRILFAVSGDSPVGCVALLVMGEREFEVSKLAVAPDHQGKGIGRLLVAAAIHTARLLNAQRLYLETNHILTPAIRLYESMGFRQVDPRQVTPSAYARADVYMELLLT